MLHYFASQDMLISHTLSRHFFWNEYILWKDDIPNLPLTVTLSGKDLIVPKEAVWKYLTGSEVYDVPVEGPGEMAQRTREAEQGLMKVVWFDEFDHAGLFASRGARRGLARTVLEHRKTAGRREDHA